MMENPQQGLLPPGRVSYSQIPTSDRKDVAKVIDGLVEKKNAVLALYFHEKVKSDDVFELVQTAQRVENILKKIAKNPYLPVIDQSSLSFKIFQRSLDKVEASLNDYHKTLSQEDKGGMLYKALGNTNFRKKVDQLNSLWLVETTALEEKYDYLAKEAAQSAPPVTTATATPGSPATTPSSSNVPTSSHPIERVPSNTSLGGRHNTIQGEEAIPIEDPEARKMWFDLIGVKSLQLESDKFLKVLTDYLKVTLNDQEKKAIKHILDNSNTGFVSPYRFSEFLKGFGGLRDCLPNVTKIVNEKWFSGFLSLDEARKFLEFQAVGTFLVRFSSSKPGSFALAFTHAPGKVTHVIISTTTSGFSIKEENGDKVFPSLNDIITYYSSVLTIPFDSALAKEPFFFGDLSAEQAEEYLANKKIGTFLIRFSSNPGYFAGSYVDANKNVGKCLIASIPKFYLADSQGSQFGQFNTMKELVQAFSNIFKYPYKNTSNAVNETVRKRIATEMFETEKTYVKALDTTLQVFLNPLISLGKAVISNEDMKNIFCNIAEIKDIHDSFLAELQDIVPQWSEDSCIGDNFVRLSKSLMVYTTYTNNYDIAMETLNRCMKQDKFKKFIESAYTNPLCTLNSLTAYLIQPIQRIPRYILLLSDLLKHTQSDHTDFESLTAALDAVKETAKAVNESKRSADKVKSVEESFVDAPMKLVTPGRLFVREGPFNEKFKSDVKDRHIFLFNDCMVHGKVRKDGKYNWKRFTSLRRASLGEFLDTSNDKHGIRITSVEGDVVLYAKSEEEKTLWIKDISKILEEVNSGPTTFLAGTTIQKSLSMGNVRASLPVLEKKGSIGLLEKRGSSSTIERSKSATFNSATGPSENGWLEALTPDGKVYYYNAKTRQTSWERPKDF